MITCMFTQFIVYLVSLASLTVYGSKVLHSAHFQTFIPYPTMQRISIARSILQNSFECPQTSDMFRRLGEAFTASENSNSCRI